MIGAGRFFEALFRPNKRASLMKRRGLYSKEWGVSLRLIKRVGGLASIAIRHKEVEKEEATLTGDPEWAALRS